MLVVEVRVYDNRSHEGKVARNIVNREEGRKKVRSQREAGGKRQKTKKQRGM